MFLKIILALRTLDNDLRQAVGYHVVNAWRPVRASEPCCETSLNEQGRSKQWEITSTMLILIKLTNLVI